MDDPSEIIKEYADRVWAFTVMALNTIPETSEPTKAMQALLDDLLSLRGVTAKFRKQALYSVRTTQTSHPNPYRIQHQLGDAIYTVEAPTSWEVQELWNFVNGAEKAE